jgi:glycosyltransferase involved in cell wall biosynthesis
MLENQSQLDHSANDSRPLRLIMIAVACSPYRGSEAGVGWNRAVQAAKFDETWVITEQGEFSHEIDDFLDKNGEIPNLHFIKIPNGWLGALLRKFRLTYYVSYWLWHRTALHELRKLVQTHPFDLVHQATYCGYREPGRGWTLRIPFVWGPLGGTQNFPWRFLDATDIFGTLREASRSLLNQIQMRFSRRVRAALANSEIVLAANTSIRDDFRRFFRYDPRVRVEIGTQHISEYDKIRRPPQRPLQILWSGELRTHKALPLLLKAITKLPSRVDVQVRILGRGPLLKRWSSLASKLGISNRVQFMKFIPYSEALKQFHWADVFVFTSLRDTTGSVILESMSHGTPVVCLDHQGARDLINEKCGVKIPVGSPNQVVNDLAAAITELFDAPERCETLGRGAIEEAKKYHWDVQGRYMAGVYREAVFGKTNGRPSETLPRMALFAFSCHPTDTMESRVGWNRILHASRRFETHVFYGEQFAKEDLEALLEEHPFKHRIHLHHVALPTYWIPFLGISGMFYFTYNAWHKAAYALSRQMHEQKPFALVHQVNFCGFREPGYGWKLNAPFLWGPVGGTQNFPMRFLGVSDVLGGVREWCRNFINRFQMRYSSRVQGAARKASIIFAANSTAQRDIQRSLNRTAQLQLEIGIHEITDQPKPVRDQRMPLRLLWAGRLRSWKGLPLLLEGLAQLPKECPYELRVMGQGNLLRSWQRLAHRLGIAQHIQWIGWPSYKDGLEQYRWADLYAFTSLRDTSGTGLLEALAAGTPLIGLDHQGFADIATDTCAIRIQPESPSQVAKVFAAEIASISFDSPRLSRLGLGALERAKFYHWDRLAEGMNAAYSQVLKASEGNNAS